MEEVTFEMIIIKGSHVCSGKDGVNVEVNPQAKVKKGSREYICKYSGLARAVLLKLSVHRNHLQILIKCRFLFNKPEGGLRCCISNTFPGDAQVLGHTLNSRARTKNMSQALNAKPRNWLLCFSNYKGALEDVGQKNDIISTVLKDN